MGKGLIEDQGMVWGGGELVVVRRCTGFGDCCIGCCVEYFSGDCVQ